MCVWGKPLRAQSQQPILWGPLGQSRRARERAASGRAGKIITEEAREGGGEAGERLNETANALVIPACLGRRRQTAMLPAPRLSLPGGTGWAWRGGNNRHPSSPAFHT